MDIKDVIEKVETSEQFKSFHTENPDAHLAHLFAIVEEGDIASWQAGYYSKKSDKITVFDCKENITMIPPQESFKEQNFIEELDLDTVNISHDDAITIAEDVLKDQYRVETATKYILLLQHLPEFDQIWNITIVTQAFSVINVKIDAQTGEVRKHSKESLLQWNRKDVKAS